MHAYELADYFWRGSPRRLGPRDSVEVNRDDKTVTYYLWGNPIAVLKDNVLTVRDCGWETWLTKNRLNNILCRIDIQLFSDRRWYLHYQGESIIWEGEHQIDMNSSPFKIIPSNLRRRSPRLSAKLRKRYQHVREFIEQNRIISARSLEGVLVVCFDARPRRGFMRDYILMKTYGKCELDMFRGSIHIYRAYKAGKTGDFRPFFNNLREVKQEEVLSHIEEFDVVLDRLPEEVISALSIRKLLEGGF